MNKKQKAAKSVNVALGLIVILAVIIFSPLFGYARGFASAEQRRASALPAPQTTAAPLPVAATPRPTPRPTPTPVVLPSAPPAPEPTPVVTPRPVAVQQPVHQAAAQPEQQTETQQAQEAAQETAEQPAEQTVQQPAEQPVQQYWPQEEYWGGEYEEDAGAADAGNEGGDDYTPDYSNSGLGEQVNNGMISTGNADIVINTGGDTQYQPEADYSQPLNQDASEGEAFTIG